MADADIIINGGIVADPRWATPGQNRVGNLTVRAGRSRKNDQGGYDQLSSTPFDVACWNEVHDLLAAQMPEKGSQVRITGTVTGVNTYQDQQGQTQASVEVRAEGVKVFPKRQPQGGYSGPPQGQGAPYSAQGGYGPQGTGNAPQGDPWAGTSGGYNEPPY
ncbi:single-stranded DNA-binding protein [Microbacterium sp.]|uniref:single-stranded DNA-binding protein n=1 Tax=Microbacterium sp. TaxID=51671 RepID=UPI003F9E903A